MTPKPTIGLIAGEGDLPVHFARKAILGGFSPAIAAIRGAASPKLDKLGAEIAWLSIGQLGGLLSFFKKRNIVSAVMHGKIQPARAFRQLKLDWRALGFWAKLKDRSGEGILQALTCELNKEGIRLLDARFLMEDLLPRPGWLTKARARDADRQSIRRGLKFARQAAVLGVGQTVVVKKAAIVAVEAMEGTDETILRAGRLSGKGTISVKVASPRQDWRYDIPTIGPHTIRSLAKVKAGGLVMESGRCFLLDRERTLETADKNGIFILCLGRGKDPHR
jgi:UDP-2,3-diacylglucosamine hydrolase